MDNPLQGNTVNINQAIKLTVPISGRLRLGWEETKEIATFISMADFLNPEQAIEKALTSFQEFNLTWDEVTKVADFIGTTDCMYPVEILKTAIMVARMLKFDTDDIIRIAELITIDGFNVLCRKFKKAFSEKYGEALSRCKIKKMVGENDGYRSVAVSILYSDFYNC